MLTTLAAILALAPVVVTSTGDPVKDDPALQAALDLAASTWRPLELDASNGPFVLKQPHALRPQGGDKVVSLTVTATNKKAVQTIHYYGTGPALTFYGLKSSTVKGITVSLRQSGSDGLFVCSDPDVTSTSNVVFEFCRVEAAVPGCGTAYMVGSDERKGPERPLSGQYDINNITFRNCGMSGYNPDASYNFRKGYWLWGSNTKSLRFDNCYAAFAKEESFLVGNNPTYAHTLPRIEGALFVVCDTSHTGLFLRQEGGNKSVVIGGRTEMTSEPYAVVTVAGGNGSKGYVKLIGFGDEDRPVPRVKAGDANNPVEVVGAAAATGVRSGT